VRAWRKSPAEIDQAEERDPNIPRGKIRILLDLRDRLLPRPALSKAKASLIAAEKRLRRNSSR
jgi:hypothetical protein